MKWKVWFQENYIYIIIFGGIVVGLGLMMWGLSGNELKEWSKQPASALTKGDVLVMILVLCWIVSFSKTKK